MHRCYYAINLVGVARFELASARLRVEYNQPLYDTPIKTSTSKLVGRLGFEPRSFGLKVRYNSQLYERPILLKNWLVEQDSNL